MAEMKYFLHQIKHTNDAYDKGIVVKDTFEAAKQSYHAYLGAYAYGKSCEGSRAEQLLHLHKVRKLHQSPQEFRVPH